MKKLLGITLVAALLFGGLSIVGKNGVKDPGGGGLKVVSYDSGTVELSAKKAYDPGGGGL